MLTLPHSHRLNFTLLGMQAAELLYEVDQDEEVMRYLNGGKRSSMADEAAQAVATAMLADKPQVRSLSAIAVEDNLGSIGVMRKLGMTFVKKYRHHDSFGELDAVLYRVSLAATGTNSLV